MSIRLFIILIVLMTVNQIMGTGYGTWKKGFDKEKFFSGLYKILLLCLGYGTVAAAARCAGSYIQDAEYISGLLLEPIARYFSKLTKSLKQILNEQTAKEDG